MRQSSRTGGPGPWEQPEMDERTAVTQAGANDHRPGGMTLADALAVVVRRWWVIVGLAAVAVVAVVALSPVGSANAPVQYQAKAILVLNAGSTSVLGVQ